MYTAEIIAVTSHKRFKLTEVRAVLVSESRLQLSYYHYYAVFCDGVGIIITCYFSTCYYVVFVFEVAAGNAANLPQLIISPKAFVIQTQYFSET